MAKTITTPAIIKMIANLAGELVKLIVSITITNKAPFNIDM